MRFWKPVAVLSLIAGLTALTLAPAANAIHSADETRFGSQSQTMTVSGNPIRVSRYAYSISVETVVQWPSADHDVDAVGDFGSRSVRIGSSYHEGDDFNPGGGTPVAAIADGVVISAGWAGALGESVAIQHTINGVTTVSRYGHMQSGSLQVSQGQTITRGTTLGLVGSTGLSSGNHLHFQIEIGGVPIDPMPWLLANVNDADWAWMQ